MSVGVVFICLLIAVAISGIIMMIIKSSLKSVRQERTACNYVRNNSLKITNQSDTFTHDNVVSRPRAQRESSTQPVSSSPTRATSTSRPTSPTKPASKPTSSTRTTMRK